MAFQKFVLPSVHAKGLWKPSWLQSHQRPILPTNLCSCVLLKIAVWCQQIEELNTAAEELHVAFQPQVLDSSQK